MPDPAKILTAMTIAALVAAMVVAVLSRASVSLGGALAVVSGLGVGVWLLGLRPHFPPAEAIDRLMYVLLPAVVVAELVAITGRKTGLIVRNVVAYAATPTIAFGSTYVTDVGGPGSRQWTTALTLVIYGGVGVGLALVWWSMEKLTRRTKSPSAVAVFAITSSGSAVALMLSGSATDGQLGLALGAAVFAVASVGFFLKLKSQPSGAVGVAVVAQAGLLLLGWLFAELNPWHAAALMTAPLLAWLPEMDASRLRPWIRAGVRLTLPASAVVAVLLMAQRQFAADGGPAATGTATIEDYLGIGR